MRIVFVTYDRPGYAAGPVVNLRRLLPELKRRGHCPSLLVLCHSGYSSAAECLRPQGIECRAVPWDPYTERNIRWILKQLRELRPDVFVPNVVSSALFAARWAREAGVPTIGQYMSDDEYDKYHAGIVEQFVLGEPKWALSGMVCVAHFLHDRLTPYSPAHTRTCVIPHGVPIPAEVASQDGPLQLVYVGRLEREQKQAMLVAGALCRVLEQMPGTGASIIGHGSEQQRITELVRARGMEDRVRVMGPVPPERLHDILLRHHVVVLLSDYEGTPGCLMDGMACGLVPVSLDIPGGVRELVRHGETGLLVQDRGDGFDEADSDFLAVDQSLRERLSRNAREHIISGGFSLDPCVTQWEEFCDQLLRESTQASPIRIPGNLDLPSVLPSISREDRRLPPLSVRFRSICGRIRRKIGRTVRSLGGAR